MWGCVCLCVQFSHWLKSALTKNSVFLLFPSNLSSFSPSPFARSWRTFPLQSAVSMDSTGWEAKIYFLTGKRLRIREWLRVLIPPKKSSSQQLSSTTYKCERMFRFGFLMKTCCLIWWLWATCTKAKVWSVHSTQIQTNWSTATELIKFLIPHHLNSLFLLISSHCSLITLCISTVLT